MRDTPGTTSAPSVAAVLNEHGQAVGLASTHRRGRCRYYYLAAQDGHPVNVRRGKLSTRDHHLRAGMLAEVEALREGEPLPVVIDE